MIDEILAKFEGAFADNTLRAYRSDFNQFSLWCQDNNVQPLHAIPDDFACYIEYMANLSSSSTIRRRVASISSVLKLSGHNDPTKSPEAILAIKRMHRRKGRAQHQATPLTKNILTQLLAVCGNNIQGIREAVILNLGYETMRRRAELCRFKFEDIVRLPNCKTGLRLNFSKTDQLGTGKLIPISLALYNQLQEWGEYINSTNYILRSRNKHGDVGVQRNPASINRRLKTLQDRANLKMVGTLSGHSFRVGAALDLLDSGESLERIMLRGGWQAESTALKYLREWQAI